MREKSGLLIRVKVEERDPQILVRLWQSCAPHIHALRDALPRGRIAQARRRIAEADRLKRKLNTGFAAVAIECRQHERMQHGKIGRRGMAGDGILQCERAPSCQVRNGAIGQRLQLFFRDPVLAGFRGEVVRCRCRIAHSTSLCGAFCRMPVAARFIGVLGSAFDWFVLRADKPAFDFYKAARIDRQKGAGERQFGGIEDHRAVSQCADGGIDFVEPGMDLVRHVGRFRPFVRQPVRLLFERFNLLLLRSAHRDLLAGDTAKTVGRVPR